MSKRKLSLVQSSNKANIFLGLIEYELNSLLGASHLVDYVSVHVRFDLERYLLNMHDALLILEFKICQNNETLLKGNG